MPDPVASIDYKKCLPDKCNNGPCYAVKECPNNVLRQEEPGEFPYSHPSRYCRGCAKCVEACPYNAITIVIR